MKSATRYLTIHFKSKLSKDDLTILYRVINRCNLAIVYEPAKNEIEDDFEHDIRTFRFIVRDPIDLNYAMAILKKLMISNYTSTISLVPDSDFKEWIDHRKIRCRCKQSVNEDFVKRTNKQLRYMRSLIDKLSQRISYFETAQTDEKDIPEYADWAEELENYSNKE